MVFFLLLTLLTTPTHNTLFIVPTTSVMETWRSKQGRHKNEYRLGSKDKITGLEQGQEHGDKHKDKGNHRT